MVGWWLYPGYDSFVPSMLPGLEKARQAELVEFPVFLVFSRKGGNKLIDINTKRTKITDFKNTSFVQVQVIWRFLVNLLISRYVFFFRWWGPAKRRQFAITWCFSKPSSSSSCQRCFGHPIGIGSTWATLLLFEQVESSWQCPFWKAFAAAAGMPKQQAGVDFAPLVTDIGSIMVFVDGGISQPSV